MIYKIDKQAASDLKYHVATHNMDYAKSRSDFYYGLLMDAERKMFTREDINSIGTKKDCADGVYHFWKNYRDSLGKIENLNCRDLSIVHLDKIYPETTL